MPRRAITVAVLVLVLAGCSTSEQSPPTPPASTAPTLPASSTTTSVRLRPVAVTLGSGAFSSEGEWIGPNVSIDVERPSTGETWSGSRTIDDPRAISVGDLPWTFQAGDRLGITDSATPPNTTFYEVHGVEVWSVDQGASTISGWASPGFEVTVRTVTPLECTASPGPVVAESGTGLWSVAFVDSDCMNPSVGSSGRVEVRDDDSHNVTVVAWNTNEVQVMVDRHFDQVNGNGWQSGDSVVLDVQRADGSAYASVHAESVPVVDEGFTHRLAFDLEVGDRVRAMGVSSRGFVSTAEVEITDLSFASDGIGETTVTVTGSAGGSHTLIAQAWGADDSFAWRIERGVSGPVTFDFSIPGDQPGESDVLTAPIVFVNVDDWEVDEDGATHIER
jgi:hypothetical protein